jgi:hypothetical protein
MAYLALPYNGKFKENCPRYRKELSFQVANAVAARLIEDGEVIYSPISHSHPISDYMVDLANDHDFWMAYNERMMSLCDRIYVLKIEGWRRSRGVRYEIGWFLNRDLPVFLMEIDSETGAISRSIFKPINGSPKVIINLEQRDLFNS